MAKVKEFDPVDELVRKHKVVTLRRIAEFKKGLDVYSTGILPLDIGTGEIDPNEGNGGIRSRSIVEVAGENNCFKTGITDQIILATQKRYPGICVAAVYSEPPNTDRMEALGIDLDRIIALGCYHPEVDRRKLLAEEALDTLIDFAKQTSIKVCLVDSVGALPASKQIYTDNKERDLSEGSPVAAQANVINHFLKEFKVHNEVSSLIMVNHWKEQINTGFGGRPMSRAYTPGGRGMEFDSDLRILTLGSPLWTGLHSKDQVKLQKGIEVNLTLFKMKISGTRAFRKTKFEFDFKTKKINNLVRLLEFSSFFGYKSGSNIISPLSIPVAQAGSWFYIQDKSFQGIDNAVKFLEENQDMAKALEKDILLRQEQYYEDDKPVKGLDDE